jgi:hypothetical protein
MGLGSHRRCVSLCAGRRAVTPLGRGPEGAAARCDRRGPSRAREFATNMPRGLFHPLSRLAAPAAVDSPSQHYTWFFPFNVKMLASDATGGGEHNPHNFPYLLGQHLNLKTARPGVIGLDRNSRRHARRRRKLAPKLEPDCLAQDRIGRADPSWRSGRTDRCTSRARQQLAQTSALSAMDQDRAGTLANIGASLVPAGDACSRHVPSFRVHSPEKAVVLNEIARHHRIGHGSGE